MATKWLHAVLERDRQAVFTISCDYVGANASLLIIPLTFTYNDGTVAQLHIVQSIPTSATTLQELMPFCAVI